MGMFNNNQRDNMNDNAQAAYNELEKKGYAIEQHSHHGGEFQILCDGADDRKGVGDYWQRGNTKNNEVDDFGISKKVRNILNKYGMWSEWINSEIAAIHKD